MTDRRDFLKATGAAAVGLAIASRPARAHAAPAHEHLDRFRSGASKELLLDAINAAKMAGASYADCRIARFQQNFVVTREQQIINVVDTDTLGAGVRALVDGCWGFAATRTLTRDGVTSAAREAVAIAKANRVARDRAVTLAPTPAYPNATWKSPYTTDPFEVPLEQKVDLLLKANAEAMKVPGVKFVNSVLFFVKQERSVREHRGLGDRPDAHPQLAALHRHRGGARLLRDFQSRAANEVAPMGRGFEYVLQADLVGRARKWGEEAAEKLKAKPVEVGKYDLVLAPSNLWLTIHESIGHPTELDRAMGYEANYAGTSFIAPPEEKLGKLQYGKPIMNIQGDRSQEGGARDHRVRRRWREARRVPHRQERDLQRLPDHARAGRRGSRAGTRSQGQPMRSHGCSYADSWGSVAFQRMPNVSLLPAADNTSWNDLIAGVDNGIAIVGDGSFSIDQQRYNAQFGGQTYYEIKGGKLGGMLKDVAYQIRTPDFWNSMDAIGGRASYELGGSFFDGKGQPSQSNAVSHGAPPARFRQVNVINTGRTQ
jgi:TldD protein